MTEHSGHESVRLDTPRGHEAGLLRREHHEPASENVGDLLPAAMREPGPTFDDPLRQRLERGLRTDFSHVRLHGGRASADAAEALGARAFTIGRDIYLGAEAHRLTGVARHRMLAHEAVHTVQQGARPVGLSGALTVTAPGDASEREAHAVADSMAPAGARSQAASPSLALRGQLRHGAVGVSRLAAPAIQRDLTKSHKLNQGEFKVNLKTESNPGAKSGMSGTIAFHPNAKAPDSDSIKLLQIVRDFDPVTDKDDPWTGAEADRDKMRTKKAKGVRPGFYVDHFAAMATPRTSKSDPAVSPYYRSYAPNTTASQDGSKKGKAIKHASLWDFPGASYKLGFHFETAAKDASPKGSGHIYGTLKWGFRLTDPAKGKVENEYAIARDTQTTTFDATVKAFDEFYQNPGSSTAPTK